MRRVTQNNEEIEHVQPEPEHIEVKTEESALWDIFPQEHVEPLRGLLFVGKLEHEFEFAGHTFAIRTLTEGEYLRIGQLTKSYKGTSVEPDARLTFIVAACIERVDGEPIYTPISDEYDLIYEKAKVVKKWYPAVIAKVFSEYNTIEKTAREVIESLKK